MCDPVSRARGAFSIPPADLTGFLSLACAAWLCLGFVFLVHWYKRKMTLRIVWKVGMEDATGKGTKYPSDLTWFLSLAWLLALGFVFLIRWSTR